MKIPIRRYIRLLSRYLQPQWPWVLVLGLLLAGSITLQLMNPQIIRYFIDTALEGGEGRTLTIAALLFIGMALLQQVFAVLATYVSQNVGWTATNQMRTDLVTHCLGLDLAFYKEHRPGELIERVDGDVTALFNFFSKFMLTLLNNGILLLGILLLLFREDWRIGLGMSLFTIIAMTILFKAQSIAVPHWVEERSVVAKFFGFVGEQIESTADIKANGAIEHVMQQFYRFLRQWYPIQRKAHLLGYSMWWITIAVFALGNGMAFGLSGYLWTKGLITIGTVYLIFHYTELLSRPMEQIRRELQDLQKSGASIRRVEELFQIQSAMLEGIEELPTGPLAVQIQNLSFSYEDDTPVLREISLELEAGKIMGVLGRTGSGKTTLARLLNRLYDPQTGEIYLGGKRIDSLLADQLRQGVAYVTQDVQLFKGTIRDNLTFFDREISDQMIMKALQEIGLGDWFNGLVDGLDTVLESGGSGLSAGEAQLLAFVRVFLRNPGLIILDEASSRLDQVTEKLMEGAISKLLENRTGIIIAHRLRTVERADEILILDQGRVLEQGERQELAQNDQSYFSRLLKAGIEEVLV